MIVAIVRTPQRRIRVLSALYRHTPKEIKLAAPATTTTRRRSKPIK